MDIVELNLRYQNHAERVFYAVTNLGKQNVIMGHTWLGKHNPDINWVTGDIKMSRCSGRCCSGCRDEIREEGREQKIQARHIADCSEGEIPDLDRDDEDDVNEFTERMKNTLEEAKAALVKSKGDMARYYNQRRTPAPDYSPGDKVYLDASDISTTRPSQKLSHQRLGPFTVEWKVGNRAYRLHLPLSMKWIHPVFNVVKLTPSYPRKTYASSPAPRNHRWRRGMGSGRHTRQQDNQSEVVVPSEMEGLRSGAQLMGTSGKHSCTTHHRGFLSETPRSHKTHPVGRIFFPPFPTHYHAETSRF